MKSIKLLDCTLRDGGFINDWAFGYDNTVNIFERLVSAGVDLIEVGLLDDRRPFDIDRTIFPDTDGVQRIFGQLDKGNATVMGMIDYGTCDIANVAPCAESFLDGIRVIFKKKDIDAALTYCKQIKDKGYMLFVNPVSITGYTEAELLSLIEKINALGPAGVSIVDTYGLLNKDKLACYLKLFDGALAPALQLGFHSHNNFQLGYANCIEFMEFSCERDCVVDSSLFGMGKGAGNPPSELIAMHINKEYGKRYKLSQMLEAIDVSILEINKTKGWGYSLQYFLAASNDCHPTYVSFLIGKRTLSVKSINELLAEIPVDKKLAFDQPLIEALYHSYQNREVNEKDDLAQLRAALAGREVLLVGPGKNILTQSDEVAQWIDAHDPVILSINHIPVHIKPHYVFVTNAKRYVQLSGNLLRAKDVQLIATSNVTRVSGNFDFTLNYSDLLDESGVFPDNSLLMLLKVMRRLGVPKVYLAGFDGYKLRKASNYMDATLEREFYNKELAEKVNEDVTRFLNDIAQDVEIVFLTKSAYAGS